LLSILAGGIGFAPYGVITGGFVSAPPSPGPSQLLTDGLAFQPFTIVLGGLGNVSVSTATDLRQGIVAYLSADATLSAIVSGRIRPGRRPQLENLPEVIYRVVSNVPGRHLRGKDGTSVARVTFSCWGLNLADCVAAKKAIDDLLGGFSGLMGSVVVRTSWQLDEEDEDDLPEDGSDRNLFHTEITFRIDHIVIPVKQYL
jgi:hypothetical protein